MSNYLIGLDFGTYQTKASINHLDKQPQKHEFFEFNLDGKKSFFLPSKVIIRNNGLLAYGNYTGSDIKHEFNYFKMASAEHAGFNVSQNLIDSIYNYANSYNGYTPEFLSVIYITHVLLSIKEYLNKNKSTGIGRFSGLFAGLRKQETEKSDFKIRMGIPTEYSKEVNLLRRKKFETILLISEMLQEEINYSLSDFSNMDENYLAERIKDINDEIPLIEEDFNYAIEQRKFSVFPESAAGLLYFIKSGKLKKGALYATIDIGGGTTDMSFFNVKPDGKIKYFSSDSYMEACNNIYINSVDDEHKLEDIKRFEEEIIQSIKHGTWEENKQYQCAVRGLRSKLGGHLKKMINVTTSRGALSKFPKRSIMETLKNQPIILYGGGLAHPQIESWSEIEIYDSGSRTSINYDLITSMDINDINLYKPDKELVINKNWEDQFAFLIVAFGLSYLNRSDETFWDDDEYKSIKLEKLFTEVPHPSNEGMYVYKVLEGEWSGVE